VASLGHIAVGMAAARVSGTGSSARRASLTAMLLWAALSFLPDADVIGFSSGVRYEDEWGHRGATHSFAFSLAVGVVVGLLSPLFGRSALRTGITAALVLTSHALLDTLTDGGLGCALFWPFDQTRYFAPWRPIPVSPIGFGYLSPYGMFVAAAELLLFAPLLWFALAPRTAPGQPATSPRRRLRNALIGVWLIGLWLIMSTDPIRERAVRVVLQDDTEFTAGFSEAGLAAVEPGEGANDVRRRLGPPFNERLFYEGGPGVCTAVRVDNDVVALAEPADPCKTRGVHPGASRAAVEQALGAPDEMCWVYSRTPDGGYYRLRAVCFDANGVTDVIRRWLRE
jgi:inner membrane protein